MSAFEALARVLGVAARYIVSAIWRSVLSAAVMASVLLAYRHYWPSDADFLSSLGQLLALTFLGVASYALSCFGLWALSRFPKEAEWQVISALRQGRAHYRTGMT